MARPQLEDGHTRIANELLEHLMKLYLAPNHWQILMFVIRKTYGFQKKVDYIANCQIVEATGLTKSTVSRALKSLEEMNIITREGKHIGIQKDWEKWLSDKATKVSNADNQSCQSEQQKLAEPTTNTPQTDDKKLSDRQPKLADRQPKLADRATKVSSPRVTQKKKETIQKKLIQKKELKQKLGEFLNVFLTSEEHEKLVNKFGEAGTDKWIESLSTHLKSVGKPRKYDDHYATILNWARREEAKSGANRQSSRQLTPRESYTRPEDA